MNPWKLVANSLKSMSKYMETSMVPLIGAIKKLEDNSVPKSDLIRFKEDWKKEMEEALSQHAYETNRPV
jgi:hypothetical protein